MAALQLNKAVFRLITYFTDGTHKTGTAWFFTNDLLLTAAHCIGDPETKETPIQTIHIEIPDLPKPVELKVLDGNWDLDVALLQVAPAFKDSQATTMVRPLPICTLPAHLEPASIKWSGRGFPAAHPTGLHPYGTVSHAQGNVFGQPALELQCEYGGEGELQGLSGSPVVVGKGVVGLIRFGPPKLKQRVIHATELAKLTWPQVLTLLSSQPLQRSPWTDPKFIPPRLPSPYFTGRTKELEELRQSFFDPVRSNSTLVQALCGLSGVGKTELALQYALIYQGSYEGLYWLSYTSSRDGNDNLAEAANKLHSQMNDKKPYLLVVDGADPPERLAAFLYGLPSSGHVLVTTNSDDPTALHATRPIRLQEFPKEEAIEFLLKRATKHGDPGGNFTDADKVAAQELAKNLRNFPAFLEQAGQVIAGGVLRFSDYEPASEDFLEKLILQGTPTEESLALLQATTLLGKDPIPHEIFLGKTIFDGFPRESGALSQAITTLKEHSLLQHDGVKRTIQVPIWIHEIVEGLLEKQAERSARWLTALGGLLQERLEARPIDKDLCFPLVPVIRHALRQMEKYSVPLQEIFALLEAAATTYLEMKQPASAAPFLQSQVDVRRRVFRDAQGQMVEALTSMGKVQHELNQRNEAQLSFRRALELCLASEGDGASGQAGELYRSVLAQVTGLGYPLEVSSALSGLVRVLCTQGQDVAALEEIKKLTTHVSGGSPAPT